MDKLSFKSGSFDYQILEKHTYPKWIRILFVGILFIFLSVVPSFIINDLPYHFVLGQKISEADECFHNQNYVKALKLYSEILEKHSDFTKGRIQSVKCCFALTCFDPNYFKKGIDLLSNEKYSEREAIDISEYLPERYREYFISLFEFEKSDNPLK